MACCAIGLCGRRDQLTGGPGMVYDARERTWSCYMCYVMPQLFTQPELKRQAAVEAAILEDRTENPGRAGDPKLAAARERQHPMFVKRHRAGPNWVPPARRV